jgi:DNA-binding HxlR family transcriptional regulator
MTAGTGTAYQQNPEPDSASLEAVELASSILRKRWRSAILLLLASGQYRYNALLRRFPGITAKVLTQQLREMEREGLVVRTAHRQGPRHVEYALTPRGQALRPAIDALTEWARVQSQRDASDRASAQAQPHRLEPQPPRPAPADLRLSGNRSGRSA